MNQVAGVNFAFLMGNVGVPQSAEERQRIAQKALGIATALTLADINLCLSIFPLMPIEAIMDNSVIRNWKIFSEMQESLSETDKKITVVVKGILTFVDLSIHHSPIRFQHFAPTINTLIIQMNDQGVRTKIFHGAALKHVKDLIDYLNGIDRSIVNNLVVPQV